MLPHFLPYPDEIIYSALARLRKFSDATVDEMKGELDFLPRQRIKNHLFPVGLDLLAGKLWPQWNISAEDLFEGHTILPYYRQFNLPETFHFWKQLALGSPASLVSRLGYTREPKRIKFCAKCSAQDKVAKIEPYLRRQHQILGVEVCAIHEEYLSSTSLSLYLDFATLEEVRKKSEVTTGRPSAPLITLAKDMESCLIAFRDLEPRTLLSSTEIILREAGLLLEDFKSAKRLEERVAEYLGPSGARIPQVLAAQSTIKTGLLRHRTRRVEHPFRYLVLFRALGLSPAEAVAVIKRGPRKKTWVCINPICTGYRAAAIDRSQKIQSKSHFSVLLRCPRCGMTYALKPRVAAGLDATRRRRIVDFGKLWNDRFCEMWRDPKLNFNQIVKALGFHRESPNYYQAAEMNGLPTDRYGRGVEFRAWKSYHRRSKYRRSELKAAKAQLDRMESSNLG